MSVTSETSQIDFVENLRYPRNKYFIAGLCILLLWVPWAAINIYVFHVEDTLAYRIFVGLLGILLSVYSRLNSFKSKYAEWFLCFLLSLICAHPAYMLAIHEYRILWVAGALVSPIACSVFVHTLKHYLFTVLPMLILMPIFAINHNSPQESWLATTLLMATMDVVLAIMLRQRVKNQNELVATIQKLGDSERARMQSAKMASLGEMAGGIAHEINNPMSIITGKAGMILRWAEQKNLDPEKIKASSLKIIEIVDRIGKITKGLLVYARDGEKDPFKNCDLSATVDHTLEMLREKLQENKVALKWNKPEHIYCDCRETQIAQTLINLMNNAIEAVLIKDDPNYEKLIEVKLEVKDEWCLLSVIDSGPGVSPHIVDKIFQPFFSTKEIGKGTGMGLSTASGVAQSHNGKLQYDFDLNKTRFILSIPLKQDIQENVEASAQQIISTGRPGTGSSNTGAAA